MKYVLTCFGFLGLAMFNVPHWQSKALDSAGKHHPTCSYSIEAGSLLQREGNGRFTIAGKSIQVKSVGSFGGLSELSVMRFCDRKEYEIRAWRTKLGYVVSKVD